MGYGTSSDYIAPSFWDFAEKVPVTLEIIDNEDPIRDYLATIKPLLDELPKGCLITAEDVDIIFLKHGEKEESRCPLSERNTHHQSDTVFMCCG